MTAMRRVVIVVPDLFFAARIRAVAEHLGVDIQEATAERLIEYGRARRPDLVIVDLHGDGDPIARVGEFKRDPGLREVRVVGFYSHVDEATRRAALEAGADRVLPRSAFTARLAAILEGEP